MGEIAVSDRQITLFYSSKSSRAKQTLAYAKAEGLPIQEIDILKTKLTGTQIVELAERLNLLVADLINQIIRSFISLYNWVTVSSNN